MIKTGNMNITQVGISNIARPRTYKPCHDKRALSLRCIGVIIGIKHGFSCINFRQVPREVLKTEAGGCGFQHLPRDLANVNALENHVRSL